MLFWRVYFWRFSDSTGSSWFLRRFVIFLLSWAWLCDHNWEVAFFGIGSTDNKNNSNAMQRGWSRFRSWLNIEKTEKTLGTMWSFKTFYIFFSLRIHAIVLHALTILNGKTRKKNSKKHQLTIGYDIIITVFFTKYLEKVWVKDSHSHTHGTSSHHPPNLYSPPIEKKCATLHFFLFCRGGIYQIVPLRHFLQDLAL